MCISVFLFLFMLTIGGNLTLLPQLTIFKVCSDAFNSTTCDELGKKRFRDEEDIVYKKAASWNILIFETANIPALITILPVGALSDLIPKKKLLLIPPVATMLQCLIYISVAKYNQLNLGYLALGSFVACVYGDIQGAIMLAYSYMASLTSNGSSDHGRTARMATLEGTIFIGQGLGSYFAGMLLQKFGYIVGFSITLAASLVNMLFILCFLPELPISKESTTTEHSENNHQAESFGEHFLSEMKQICQKIALFIKRYFNSSGKFVVLFLFAAFFCQAAVAGESLYITLFLKHSPLSLNPCQVGSYLLTLHCTRGVGIIVLSIIVAKYFRPSDYVVSLIGLLSLVATHISVSLSTTKLELYSFAIFSFAVPYAMSAIRAMLTKRVQKEEQGTVLSFVGLISLVGVNIMTFAGNSLLRATAKVFPGFCILLLSILSFIALMIIISLFYISKQEDKEKICDANEYGELVEKNSEDFPLIPKLNEN